MREAFLIHKGVLYFSAAPPPPHGRFVSPVPELILGIAERFPGQSLRMLRERIHTSFPPTPVCEGMVRIAAKRMSAQEPEKYRELSEEHAGESVPVVSPAPAVFSEDSLPPRGTVLAEPAMAPALRALKLRGTGPKSVGALVLGPSGELLEYAWNTSASNQALHAELNLSRSWLARGRGPLPPGSTWWTSLEPCAMCAAQILNASPPGHPIRVRFLEHDSGPSVRHTCLVQGSEAWQRADRPEIDLSRA